MSVSLNCQYSKSCQEKGCKKTKKVVWYLRQWQRGQSFLVENEEKETCLLQRSDQEQRWKIYKHNRIQNTKG